MPSVSAAETDPFLNECRQPPQFMHEEITSLGALVLNHEDLTPSPNNETLREYAILMQERVRLQAVEIHDSLQQLAAQQPRVAEQVAAIDEAAAEPVDANSPSQPNDFPCITSHSWIPEIIHHILKGQPLAIHINTAHGIIRNGFQGPFTEAYPATTTILAGHVAALLRDTRPHSPNSGPIKVIGVAHDRSDAWSGEPFTDQMSLAIARFGLERLSGTKAIQPEDPFIYLTTSSLDEVANTLQARIGLNGKILHDRHNASKLMPQKSFVNSLIPPGQRYFDLTNEGIPLYDKSGEPSRILLQATSMLAGHNPNTMHLHMPGRPEHEETIAASVLLKTARLLRHDLFRTIYVDTAYVPEEVQLYAFTQLLDRELSRYIAKLEGSQNFQSMKPKKYVDVNYGEEVDEYDEGILPTDLDAIDTLAHEAPFIIEALQQNAEVTGQPIRLVSIGHGPLSYAVLPFANAANVIELADPAADNLSYLLALQHGTLEPRYSNVGEKFEAALVRRDFADRYFARTPDHINSPSESRFYGCNDRLRTEAIVSSRVFEKLEADSVDILIDSFTGCSYSAFKTDFFKAQRLKAMAMRKNIYSRTVSMHMVRSTGWNYAGAKFPSPDLSEQDLIQGYLEAGFRIKLFRPLIDNSSLRDGYEKMVLIIASLDPDWYDLAV